MQVSDNFRSKWGEYYIKKVRLKVASWELTEVFGRFCDSNKELDFFRASLVTILKALGLTIFVPVTHTAYLYKLPVTVGYMSRPAPLNINIACAANSKGSIFAPGILLLLALKGL